MQVKNSPLLNLIKNFANGFNSIADHSGFEDYATFFQKLINETLPILQELELEIAQIGQIEKEGMMSVIKSWNFLKIDSDKLFQLVLTAIDVLFKKSTSTSQAALSRDIQYSLNKMLILIQDCKINQVYSQAPNRFTIYNPNIDYWFQRLDKSGSYQFNADQDIYLINTIPVATSESYYNSELYNKPYTTLNPNQVAANPFSEEAITDTYGLGNLLYDLLMNIPTSSNHRIIFEAKIKVDNLYGGSRGWGFWNTDSVSVEGTKTAWFMQQSEGNKNKFYAHTFNNQLKVTELPVLDEEWHHYKISLNPNSVEYFVDGVLVESVSDSNCIPDVPMAFHNWVDNACFDIEKGGEKQLQTTDAPRSNMMADFWIYTV